MVRLTFPVSIELILFFLYG